MRLLKSTIHQDIESLEQSTVSRIATRAIVLKGEMILMLYTARYHDYTLPGGGLDAGEELVAGMIRELQEETGAKNIHDIQEFGLYEEYRPWQKDDFSIMHMQSYCYTCSIDNELGATKFEDYEIKNGMKAVWLNIFDAIEHNEKTIKNSTKMGMSIARETYLLKLICNELLTENQQDKAG